MKVMVLPAVERPPVASNAALIFTAFCTKS